MPTVLRKGPYRFHFYSSEGTEPPHIHLARDDYEAKIWLRTNHVAINYGYSSGELNRIANLVRRYKGQFLKAWKEHNERK